MKYVETILMTAVTVFAPIKAAVLVAFILVMVDLFTGVWASWKRGQKITSAGLKRTVGKIALYEIAICAAFLCQQYLTGDLLPVFKLVTALVGAVELKSCLENLDSISGTNLFKVILDKLTQPPGDSK